MKNPPFYLFTSERLGFRQWKQDDLSFLSEMNSDKNVMEFFPSLQSEKQTQEFMERMQNHFSEKGFCYFAVDLLETNEFIGFIGLLEKDPVVIGLEPEFAPCVDIGWRLKTSAWNKGLATEGAKKCLEHGFETLGIETIVSIAPKVNLKSEQVMKKIGMKKIKNFDHLLLKGDERLEDCVLYRMNRSNFR